MELQKDGWISDAERVPTLHQDARPDAADIRLLVVHGISLPRGAFGGDAVVDILRGSLDCSATPAFAELKNLKVSAHFLIRRGGELLQFATCEKRAWHAGESAWRGRKKCNDFSIGAELEGADDIPYAQSQYNTLAKLHLALSAKYAPLFVAGHEHISPGRKTDPGAAFSWQKLFALIGEKYDGRNAGI